jgi:flagellar motor switch protein FliM
MIRQKGLFEFSRSIRLSPAIGDWTTIQYEDEGLNELNVSSIQNVNFDSLPKEQLKYVHYLHYRLAEKMTKKLSQDMDIKVELHSIEVLQMSYEDFLQMNDEKLVQTNFKFKNNSKVNVLFDWQLAEMVIDRLTGGMGESHDAQEFSGLEAAILETQMQEVKPLFVESWKVLSEDEIDVEFSSGHYVQDKKVTLREAYIVFVFNFFFGENDLKKITMAYPNMILRNLLTERKKRHDELKERIALKTNTTENIMVPVKATLGKATLPMSALKALHTGDIIPLNATLNSPVTIQFGDSTALSGQPGIFNGKACIQIIQDTESAQQIMQDDVPMKSVNPSLFGGSIDEAEKLVETIDLNENESETDYGDTEAIEENTHNFDISEVGTDQDDEYITASNEIEQQQVEAAQEDDTEEDDYFEDDDQNNDQEDDQDEDEEEYSTESNDFDEDDFQNEDSENYNFDDDDEDDQEEEANNEDSEEVNIEENQDDFSWDDLDK